MVYILCQRYYDLYTILTLQKFKYYRSDNFNNFVCLQLTMLQKKKKIDGNVLQLPAGPAPSMSHLQTLEYV